MKCFVILVKKKERQKKEGKDLMTHITTIFSKKRKRFIFFCFSSIQL
jgi:hypothetical protein